MKKTTIMKSNAVSVNAKAFGKGTQDAPVDDFLNEIEADFEKIRQKKIGEATGEIKNLEAESEITRQRKDESEARWKMLDGLHEGRTIQFFKPLLAVVAAFLLIAAEGGLLAPVMDGLNIAEFWVQLLVATLLVGALSGLLEIAVHNFHKTPRKLWLVISSATFAVVSLAIFGWWRGEEVIFAGSQDDGSTFASENALLTRILLMLVTVALPITAAFFLDFGVKHLRFWLERKEARKDFLEFSRRAEENEKKLAAANEKLAAELEAIGQERESWLASARDNFEKGRTVGAWKLPFWQAVTLPTTVAGILIFVVVMIVGMILVDPILAEFIESDAFRIALFVLLAAGLTGLLAMRFIRRWNRPTDEELFNQTATHWRNAENPNSLRLLEDEKRRSLIGKTDDEWQGKTIAATR